MFVPLALLAAFGAWRYMVNVTDTRSDARAFAAAARSRHTWPLSFIYIGTFGSFIGYAGVFPTLLKRQFPEVTVSMAFLGALVGLGLSPNRRRPRRPVRRRADNHRRGSR